MCVISDTFENLPKILLSFNCLLLNHYNTDDTNANDSQLVWIPRILWSNDSWFLKKFDGIHSIQSFYKSVHEFKCDLDNVGPLKHLLPKNDTMQDIKFAPEDETWILGKCIPEKIKQSSLQARTMKNLLIQL